MGKNKGEAIECFFASLSVQKLLGAAPIKPPRVTTDKKTIFFGNGNFSTKQRDITHFEVVDSSSIRLYTSEDKVIEMRVAQDANKFAALVKRLEALCRKLDPQVTSFIEKSSGKALGALKKRATATATTSASRGVFGKGGRGNTARTTTSSVARSVFDQQPNHGQKSIKQRNKPFALDLQYDFSDEETETEQPFVHESSDVEQQRQEEDDGMDWSDHPSDDDEEEEEEEEETGTSKVSKPAKQSKKRATKSRIQRKVRDDDSDDDDLFMNDGNMTTPATQRHVSPGTHTLPKNGQGTLMSFFGVKDNTTSRASKHHIDPIEPSSRDRTPLRHRSPSSKRFTSPSRYTRSPHAARILRESQKKNEIKTSIDWLSSSPKRVSSNDKAREALRGRFPSPRSQVDEDAIGEFSPRATVPLISKPFSLTRRPFGPSTERGRLSDRGGKQLIAKRPRLSVSNYPSRSLKNNEASEELEQEKPAFRFRGLFNLGNTCYMASSLQMLYTATEFMKQLPGRGGPLTQKVVKLAGELADTSDNKPINPSGVKEAMDHITDKFAGFLQRDAHEFLSDLVDGIHEELEKEPVADGDSDSVATLPAESVGQNETHEQQMLESLGTVETTVHISPLGETDEHVEDDLVGYENDTADEPNKENHSLPINECVDTPGYTLTKVFAEPATMSDGNQVTQVKESTTLPPGKLLADTVTDVSAEVSSPTDDFRLTVQVCLQCDACGYTRTKEEIYRHLSIDVCSESGDDPGTVKASVEAGLTRFFQPETRELNCENCSDGTQASQTLSIVSRPMFLILHLKRFIWVEKPIVTAVGSDENAEPNSQPCRTEYVFKKKQDPVELSEVVDLAPFRAPQVEWNSSSAKYSLKSIVYHHGMRAESGHYSTDALRSLPPGTVQADGSTTTEATPVWVEFDDTSTSLTSLEKIVSAKFKQERAYILLYCLD